MKMILSRGDRERLIQIEPNGLGYDVTLEGRRHLVSGTIGAKSAVLIDQRPIEASVRRDGDEVVVQLSGLAYSFRTRDARAPKLDRRGRGADLSRGELHAPMPGLVIEVLAQVGDEVDAGRPLVIVEAMKMQNALVAPLSGTITGIAVKPGVPVDSGQLLVTVTPGGP